MPWYMNITREAIRTVKADGSHLGIDPRTKVFVPAAQVSAEISLLVKANKLRYRGSGQDLEPPAMPSPEVSKPEAAEVMPDPVMEADVEVAKDEDDESNMLAISDIEGQPDMESGDGVPEPKRRRRRKRQ